MEAIAMENILSLCKRRGFIYPSSEIYGGIGGFYDYGPMGCELKRNIRDAWWQDVVHRRRDVVGMDGTIIMHPSVWKASGHVDGFSDPMVDCRESKMRYRADQLFFSPVVIGGKIIGYVSKLEDEGNGKRPDEMAEKIKNKHGLSGKIEPMKWQCYADAAEEIQRLIPSPATGNAGTLTPPRAFNLMFETHVGAVRDDASVAYLRPETAQGIFVNFKNILDTSRKKIPFGIAQIGRSFRNEITPRNFIFRSREFEQMELEYFISPHADWQKLHSEWVEERLQWHRSIGIRGELLGLAVHSAQKLAHYSRACTDITFRYPFGEQELEGIAARGDYDLSQHQSASGKSLEYFDEESGERCLAHVIEPSVGVDRIFLAVLCSAYEEDEVDGERRMVLHLHPRIAPIKAAILPLVKNKPEIVSLAEDIYRQLQRHWNVAYDASGAIGRRYRRMDEVGTPFAVTVDFESIENETVTVRERSSMEQIRLHRRELSAFLMEKISGI
ncbi:MAG: glycine--tRNA ligase [Puniceicoccales bacterium]|jgi:glycyl-tRNA synthetase|nr:glycine--tRNA ligase [Puniceicoccales bacterium]